jgi:hypothetical protein
MVSCPHSPSLAPGFGQRNAKCKRASPIRRARCRAGGCLGVESEGGDHIFCEGHGAGG